MVKVVVRAVPLEVILAQALDLVAAGHMAPGPASVLALALCAANVALLALAG